MRTYLEAGGGLLLIGALWFGAHQLLEAREARGAADLADERAAGALQHAREVEEGYDSLRAVLRGARATLDAERATNEALTDSLDSLEADQEIRVAAAGDSVDATVDSLEASVPDPIFPTVRTLDRQIDEERAGHESVKQTLRSQNANLQAIIVQADSGTALCSREFAACEERVDALQAVIEETTRARDEWRRAANPGFFAGFTKSVPQVVTVAGLILLASTVW